MKWISVKEKLPKECGYYICYIPNRRDSKVTEKFFDGRRCNFRSYFNVTHWMPLPEPPADN